MKIGMCGPILTRAFADHLGGAAERPGMPKGLGGTAVNLLVRGLLDRGHSVTVFSLDPSVTDEVVLEAAPLKICYGPYRPRARKHAMDFFGVERRYLRQAIARENPDIVHAHWTYEYALGSLGSGVETLVTVRDWAPAVLMHYHNVYRLVRYMMDWTVFRKARNLSATSPVIRDRISQRWGRVAPVLPNPIEPEFFREIEKTPPGESPRILCVAAGMSKLKNIESLLLAMPQIRRELPGCTLRLVGGDFAPGGKAQQFAHGKGIDNGVEYAGERTREELPAELDAADLLVQPSREESFGNTLAEAMARRVPALGGEESGAVPWVLDYGRCGELCDVNDPSSIAAAAVKILRDEKQWRKFSQAGFARARATFGLDSVVEACLLEYELILNRRRAAA